MDKTEYTLSYYNSHAEEFANGTVDVEFSHIQNEFIKMLQPGDTILDLGCGSGRDSLYFMEEGFDVTAIDGSKALCELAEIEIGEEVVHHMRFDQLEFEDVFDGVWACASLLHVKKNEFENILQKVIKSLVDGGVLYISVKHGDFEGIRDGRYYSDYRVGELKDIIKKYPELELIDIYTKRRSKDDEHSWVNVFVRKVTV
jgi:SAM-dependent methyltransferase